jgi:hypothetical protein
MKGSDSALPIWADFMRQALNLHPEWNGDWQIPDSIKKAEIDSRDGKVLRTLENAEADALQIQQGLLKKNANTQKKEENGTPEIINSFLSSVPLEFRRVELFVAGTLPVNLTPVEDPDAALNTQPEATPTPFTTWEEAQSETKPKSSAPSNSAQPVQPNAQSVTVMVCELSGMRATSKCPGKQPKTYKSGSEPTDLCQFH